MIYSQKDSRARAQQSKAIRESFHKQKESWRTDLASNSSQHEIIKQIISSTAQGASRPAQLPSDSNIQTAFFPVKSFASHFVNASDVFLNRQEKVAATAGLRAQGSGAKGTAPRPGKAISRSLPRSPFKEGAGGIGEDVRSRTGRTGAKFESGGTAGTELRRGK